MSSARPHVAARQQFPHYPARLAVRDDLVEWSVAWPDYAPTIFTAPHVLANDRSVKPGGWADPQDVTSISAAEWATRASYEGESKRDGAGRPLNPFGRTGMAERGYLGKWGPNFAADPIVTRFHPTSGQLQVVAIMRRDTGVVALPGGMVDAGEAVSATVRREFEEEAVNLPDEASRAEATQLLNDLFAGAAAKAVYRGYVDDMRNTDHAWMESSAFHFHCGERRLQALQLAAGSDAARAFWLDADPANPMYAGMMPGHRVWVEEVAKTLRQNDLLKNMRRSR